MNLLKAIIVGSVIFGSALSYAGDGYDRSMKFNEKFRAEQKRIHETESGEEKIDGLEAKEGLKLRIRARIRAICK